MLLYQGVELLAYGMGTVVLFLTLLVVATRVMSQTIGRYFPEAEPPAVPAPAVSNPQPSVSPETVAAISAALHRHRGGGY